MYATAELNTRLAVPVIWLCCAVKPLIGEARALRIAQWAGLRLTRWRLIGHRRWQWLGR